MDEGLDEDTMQQALSFDLVTDKLVEDTASYQDPAVSLLSLSDYLADTGREGPEMALTVDEAPRVAEDPGIVEPPPEPWTHPAVRAPITPRLLKSLEVSARQYANAVSQALEEALWSSSCTPLLFWEVYSGSGNLSNEMANRGFAVRTFDLPEWDFTRPADRRAFLRLMHEERPHVVWFAPPCPKWSPLQNLTARDQNQQELLDVERQSQHASHLKLTRRGFEHQYSTGGIAVVEHPKPSLAWRTPAFRDMPGWAAILDQCAVGAKLPNQYGRLIYANQEGH